MGVDEANREAARMLPRDPPYIEGNLKCPNSPDGSHYVFDYKSDCCSYCGRYVYPEIEEERKREVAKQWRAFKQRRLEALRKEIALLEIELQ